jgi:hypothetical protein
MPLRSDRPSDLPFKEAFSITFIERAMGIRPGKMLLYLNHPRNWVDHVLYQVLQNLDVG